MYSRSHADNISNQDHYNGAKELSYLQRNLNKSQNTEATFQADYTQPLKDKTTFEIGAKTVLREANSDVDYQNIYPLINAKEASENVFGYHQNVWSSISNLRL